MSRIWINGDLIDKADARVSLFDHGFLYGDGVWEPLRVFGGKLFRPAAHVDQLFRAAAALGIDIPLSQAELIAAIEATVRANDRTQGYVRAIATRGPGTLGPDPRKLHPQVYILVEEYQPFPQELYGHGLHAVVHPVPIVPENPAHRLRVLAQVHVVLAKARALGEGCLEAIFLTPSDEIAGGTEGNLFVVRGGRVAAPPGVPPDVAGSVVSELAREAAIPLSVGAVRRDDLFGAEELFLAGTSCGVIGIMRVNGTDIGRGTEGPITQTIREAYWVRCRGLGEPGA